jgi:outer membrane lipoprotein-sorting protein
MKTGLRLIAGALALSLSAQSAWAGDAARGLQIARAAKDRDNGFASYIAIAKMILRDRSGTENVRDFTAKALEMEGDGDRTSIEFQSPLDVKGMTVLTHAHRAQDDDQWLYMSANARTRRITSSSKAGSFAGSEFSYEDLAGYVVEKYDYSFLRDEPCPSAPERTCHVNEQTPKDPDSGYSRMVAWLDTQDYRGYKVEYYDRAGLNSKTLISSDFQLFDGRFWRPMKMVMSNHRTGKSTEMKWASYNFKAKLDKNGMEPFALGR